MRCGICGSEEGTAGCQTPWKHPPRAVVPEIFFSLAAPDQRDAELARLRAALAAAETIRVELAVEMEKAEALADKRRAALERFVKPCEWGGNADGADCLAAKRAKPCRMCQAAAALASEGT
jgi:hypothetical protein